MLALLLFAVPTLSTLAKDSWYLPQSNPVHFLNIASKMQIPHCGVVLHKAVVHTTAKITPLQPVAWNTLVREPAPRKPSIGLTTSLQLRSPPAILL